MDVVYLFASHITVRSAIVIFPLLGKHVGSYICHLTRACESPSRMITEDISVLSVRDLSLVVNFSFTLMLLTCYNVSTCCWLWTGLVGWV